MENLYLFMVLALAFLAIADLVVGVSNDAVNFLNSAIGSKAISFKTIMIVASIGVAVGAIFSSGLMEVARKGIFNPGEFMFDEIMIIFMAVMITDILLLDFFNSIGLPTSTTVSIVFELLGASVAMALIKIFSDNGNLSDLVNHINTSKATEIIIGIILSVLIAFSIGAVVQWFSRVVLSFNFEEKAKWIGALFGGLALTSITYFIFMKGIKGTPFANETYDIIGGATIKDFLEAQVLPIVAVSLAVWSVLSYVMMTAFRMNIYRLIIIVGTFALALAFAGNDLVNFIGVPIAAYQSYEFYISQSIPATELSMGFLSKSVETPTILLLIAGLIMVVTLWFSTKAQNVVKTSIDLSSQKNTKERFQPNFLSRGFVRLTITTANIANYILPGGWLTRIDKQFQQPKETNLIKDENKPAFDLVRAAVNLMVAAVLISIATSMKLPLSTTYVTFMVAMGTSLADRAWGAESAVYRVAGVLNVIGGWFFTALVAFISAATIAYLINLSFPIMAGVLFIVAIILLIRSFMVHRKKSLIAKAEDSLKTAESSTIQGVIHESADNIANVVKRTNKIYSNSVVGLAKQELNLLKKNSKQINKLISEIEDLRDNIFFFIKNLDESCINASNFYINILGYLEDIVQSLEYINKKSYKHINNNHKKLKFSQIKELKEIDDKLELLFSDIERAFKNEQFDQIVDIINERDDVYSIVKSKIQRQVERTRTEESSPKNTTLYFSILLETKDLIKSTMALMQEYHDAHDSSVKPAKVDQPEPSEES